MAQSQVSVTLPRSLWEHLHTYLTTEQGEEDKIATIADAIYETPEVGIKPVYHDGQAAMVTYERIEDPFDVDSATETVIVYAVYDAVKRHWAHEWDQDGDAVRVAVEAMVKNVEVIKS